MTSHLRFFRISVSLSLIEKVGMICYQCVRYACIYPSMLCTQWLYMGFFLCRRLIPFESPLMLGRNFQAGRTWRGRDSAH